MASVPLLEKKTRSRPDHFGKFSSERALKFVVEKIGKMDGARGFAANDFDDVGMRVTETR